MKPRTAPKRRIQEADLEEANNQNSHIERAYADKKNKDSQKFSKLRESKQKFIRELNTAPVDSNASMEEKMNVLVKKAENMANFLLTKHKFTEWVKEEEERRRED